MSTTISGTTGIDKVQDGTTINASSIMGALNATGTAPIYACRAWVNFNSYGTVAIRDSGNVSSIDDEDAGKYKINFTIPMLNSNYVLAGSSSSYANNNTLKTMQVTYDGGLNPMAPEYVRVSTIYNVLTREDGPYNSVAIF